MSLDEKKEEAEAILDSAEMLLETYGGTGQKANELKGKISELEQQLQDPESEKKLDSLIKDVRDLMDELKDQPMQDDSMGMDEPGMGNARDNRGGGGMGPEDGAPPF